MCPTGESFTALPVHLSARVAPELHDRILDNLHDSKKDLSVCSIVCKSWLSTCRFHLFAEVIYNPEFARFLDSSTHALNSITPYIKQATMKGPFSQKDETYLSTQSISHLKGVVKLHIEMFNWENFEPLNPTSFPLLIPVTIFSHHLTSLTLRFINFPLFTVLTTFLDAFLVLQELSLFDVTWSTHRSLGDNAPKHTTILKQSTFKKLHIERCNIQVLLNWLCYGLMSEATFQDMHVEQHHRSFPHLVVLSICDILPGERGILSRFILALGESLEHLEMGFVPYNSDNPNFNERITNAVNLASNTKLKTITIRQVMLFRFPSVDRDAAGGSTPQPSMLASTESPYACIPALISTIQSHHLQTITFCIWLSAEFHLDSIDWSQLADLFNRLEISRICFLISGIGLPLVENWFRKRLRTIDNTKTVLEFAFPSVDNFYAYHL